VTSPQEAQWVLRAQVGDRQAIEALLRSLQGANRRTRHHIDGYGDTRAVTGDDHALECGRADNDDRHR